jgi:glycosyltransferase involved in cell wall biosynthesis
VSPTRVVHVIAPGEVEDLRHPTGGNAYDLALVAALRATGRLVALHPVAGVWSSPSAADRHRLRSVLAALPDSGKVVVDGLVACAAPEVLAEAQRRMRVVVLMHMAPEAPAGPDGGGGPRQALTEAGAVVATSEWTRDRVLDLGGLAPERVHVVTPGVTPAPVAAPDPAGRRLLCVASVVPAKGHDLLLDALASLLDLDWRLVCVGDLSRNPQHVLALRRRLGREGLATRIRFTGPLTGAELAREYAASDLHVLATRAEGYGMALTESLARGVPVVAAAVDGVPEAVGRVGDGERPGLLVPPDDPEALARGLRSWLTSRSLRATLRSRARDRRTTLGSWEDAAAEVARVLDAVAVGPLR